MSGELRLHIGGLVYRVQAPPGVRLVDDHKLYRSFSAGPPPGMTEEEEEIPVALEIAEVLPPPASAVVFDSGESWLAAREGGSFRLFFRSPTAAGRFWWRATVPGGDGPIRLLFAPELLESGGALANPFHYPLDQLLSMWLLAERRGCILHAAGLGRSGRGIACIGRSGAGKTTLMAQLAGLADLQRLSDDRVVVSVQHEPMVFGTPWAGEGLVAGNLAARLEALVFLHHGRRHRLEAVKPRAAAHQLLPTTSIPWFDERRSAACLETLDALVGAVPAYDLHFRRDAGVAEVLDRLLRG